MSSLFRRTFASLGVGLLVLAGGALALAQAPLATPAPVVRADRTIPLGEAFPDVAIAGKYDFRARQLVLGPGARTEMISHAGRPSITYVTQGVVREHRVGAAAPIVHAVGAATMDRGPVSHFWENPGPGEAVLLVVEVAPRTAP